MNGKCVDGEPVLLEMDRGDGAAHGYPTSLDSQTWWSPSLPFLPRSKQFNTGEHVQFARLLVCAFTVARAAAAAASVRLLSLPRLPLLADQGAGDSRCTGHAPRGGVKQGCASRVGGWRGSRIRLWGGM